MRIETPFIFIWKGNDEEADRILRMTMENYPMGSRAHLYPSTEQKRFIALQESSLRNSDHITEFLE